MRVLLDTGILLRLFERHDPHYADIRASIQLLWTRGDELVLTAQNAAEFWNVSTRPASARGGFGQSPTRTRARLAALERICFLLPDTPAAYVEWKRLVVAHSMSGVSVHDARIAALMTVWHVTTILTLNPVDFNRFPGIAVQTPATLLSPATPP